MTESNRQPPHYSADLPLKDPTQDLFGHAPFAKMLAKAIQRFPSSDGIVLALYGPWGSGKSTVLGFVERELDPRADDVQTGAATLGSAEGTPGHAPGGTSDRACEQRQQPPLVVSFNPWWFSGQDDLARAFFGQMRAVLPSKNSKFSDVAEKLGEFSEAVGSVGDLIGTISGTPWVAPLARASTQLSNKWPQDVPALKQQLSDLLLQKQTRILVIIDDIDRLAPEEIKQLFMVIKALADFPYVTYLLAFDRDVVAGAITRQMDFASTHDGTRFLDKIVQVPFEVPPTEKEVLQQALLYRLNAVMNVSTITAVKQGRRPDSMYWHNVFFGGVAPLVRVPRDVVRLVNVLSVTYPAVVTEVNPVDFIAIEAIRLFLPGLYSAIRQSPDQFTGRLPLVVRESEQMESARSFHRQWLDTIPDALLAPAMELAQHLFPRLESVWGNVYHDPDVIRQWRVAQRICVLEIFPIYFRLSMPEGVVSRADLNELLTIMGSANQFADVFRSACKQKDSTGRSKAGALLDRFMDHITCVTAEQVRPVIEGLFQVGDALWSDDDRDREFFGVNNDARVARFVYQLLRKLGQEGESEGGGATLQNDPVDRNEGDGLDTVDGLEELGTEGVSDLSDRASGSGGPVGSDQAARLLLDIIPETDALLCAQYLIARLDEKVRKSMPERSTEPTSEVSPESLNDSPTENSRIRPSSLCSTESIQKVKKAWCDRVSVLSSQQEFLERAGIATILAAWRQWGGVEETAGWWQRNTTTDEGLLQMITAHAFKSWSQSSTDARRMISWHVNPKDHTQYGDVQEMATRIRVLSAKGIANEHDLAIPRQFVRTCERLASGQPTDAISMMEDDN